jgi:hypothetical protein
MTSRMPAPIIKCFVPFFIGKHLDFESWTQQRKA